MSRRGERLGQPLAWPAPGKLNLFLHIVGRRADGYHLLQTAFQFIDLSDEIDFWMRAPGVIEQVGPGAGLPADRDLTIRAARRLAQCAGGGLGVGIELRKRLPLEGGVGGGSSDAATVLVALNELWQLGLSANDLAQLGLELGADVPVFVAGRAAWAEGIGEELTFVDFPEGRWLVIKPDAAVRTAGIFQAPELTRDSPVITIRDFLVSGGRNDCATVVRSHHPAVAEALDWLAQYTQPRLTGTGACVFGAMNDEGAARTALAMLPPRWQGYLVRGLNRSPLAERLRLERAAAVH